MHNVQLLKLPASAQELVNIRVYFSAGSACDPDDKLGTAHFLEHVLYSELQSIVEESGQKYMLENFQAVTSRQMMMFDLDVLVDDVELAWQLIQQLYVQPTFTSRVLNRERAILNRELGENEANPSDPLNRELAEWLYSDPLLSRRNGGTVASVKTIGAEDLRDFYTKNIIEHPSLVVVSDNFAIETGLAKFAGQAIVSALPNVTISKTEVLEQEQVYGDAEVSFYAFGQVSSVHENMGAYIMDTIINNALRQVFDENGMAYDFGTTKTHLGTTVEYSLYVSVAKEEVAEAEAILPQVIRQICEMDEPSYAVALEQVVKIMRMENTEPAEMFDKVAFSAAVWGSDPAEVQREVDALSTYAFADFAHLLKQFGLADQKVRVLIRK